MSFWKHLRHYAFTLTDKISFSILITLLLMAENFIKRHSPNVKDTIQPKLA